MPCQPARADRGSERRTRYDSSGVSRFAKPAVPKLHRVPPEGPRFLRKPGITQMRFILALLLAVASFAQQPAATPAPAEKPGTAPAAPDQKPAAEQAKPAAPAEEAKPAESPAPS